MTRLTTLALRAPWKGKDRWLSDGGPRGTGRLMARVRAEGVAFLYQYFDDTQRKRYFPLGFYDASGERGLNLAAARTRAAQLSDLYRNGVHNLHAYFEDQRTEAVRAREAAEAARREAAEQSEQGSLDKLLVAYETHLRRLGKSSVRDVCNIFDNHVRKAAPALLLQRAAQVSVDEFVDLIGRLVDAGKGRTAGKLRSYLRAAYALAMKAKTDPAAPSALKRFGITTNPLANVGALSRFNRLRHRHLSQAELGHLLRRVDRLAVSALYGRGDAQTIVENCGNTLILRCSSSEGGGTAAFASHLIGQREVLRRHVSRTDAHDGSSVFSHRRRSTTTSEQHSVEPAVLPAEIEQLPDLAGYVKTASIPTWHQIHFPPDSP
jgi:hypothetical protein